MDSIRSASLALNRPRAATQAAGIQSACYVDPAPVVDVLLDQLQYLVDHKSPDCPYDCPDCERLSGAESWLLLPFRITATQGSTPPGIFSFAQTVSRELL